MSSIDIFISHSSKDVKVVEALLDLLRAALNLPASRIRCTSVDGYRLPVGASTDDQLRREVRDALVFIGVISQASIESAYVLFELGARWGSQLHLSPVVVTEADKSYLRGPIAGLNALSCDSPAQLHQLVSDIGQNLKVASAQPATYQKHIDLLVRQSKKAHRRKGRSASRDGSGGPVEKSGMAAQSPPEQLDDHDRLLFAKFINDFPSQGSALRFLRYHDLGTGFRASELDVLYEFANNWNDAEHEFNTPELEDKRKKLWAVLNIFLKELGQHTSSSHMEGWLSIGFKDTGNSPEMSDAHKRLNQLGTESYEAHQDLVRAGSRFGMGVSSG